MGFLQHRAGDLIKGRYQVLSHLGGGSFGSVYRVRDVAVGVDLACKEMHVLDGPSTATDERAAARELFKREALNLATVRHPHIPAAYFEQEDGAWNICPRCGLHWPDAGFCPDHGAQLLAVDQRYYLMMDFVDGPTLEDLAVDALRQSGRPLDEERCLEWIVQISGALRALHRVGIVHRDIKPDNIKIRTQDNAAILLDFGLTRKAEEAGGYGTFRQRGTGHLGTPGYAPPDLQELARPEARSDIYALGMTLYRLLSGRDPQDQSTLEEMRAHAPRFFNASISPAVEAVIVRAIQATAADRYASIDDLLADLEPVVSPTAVGGAAPFVFADGARVRNVSELARLLGERGPEASRIIFDGTLGRWLESIGQASLSRAATMAALRYQEHPARVVEALRRALLPGFANAGPRLHLEPSQLDFGGVDSGAVLTMALRLRNESPGLSWGRILALPADDNGLDVADGGLPGITAPAEWEGNDITVEVTLDSSRLSNGDYSGSLIFTDGEDEKTVLARVFLSWSVRPLSLRIEPAELDFGTVAIGDIEARFVRVVPVQRSAGRPRGTFYVPPELAPISVPERFEGDEPFKITLDGTHISAVAKRYDGALHINTNGGRLRLPTRFSLSLRPWQLLSLVGSHLLIGAVGAGMFRWSYAVINPEFASRWLVENGSIRAPVVAGYGAPLLLGALLGAGWELWRWTNEEAAIAKGAKTPPRSLIGRHRGSRFSPLLHGLLLSGVLGAMLCWPLIWMLHWIGWGLGDWLLRAAPDVWLSPLRALGIASERAAPWTWSLAGGGVGLMLSAARISSLLGRPNIRYAVWAILGLLLLIAFVNASTFTG